MTRRGESRTVTCALRRAALAGALVLAAGACDESGVNEPHTRDVTVTLVSPNGDEGAAVLELTGTEVLDAVMDGGEVFTFDAGASTRIVAVLAEAGTIRFTIAIGREAAPPQARVIEVAGGDDEARDSVAGYVVEFLP